MNKTALFLIILCIIARNLYSQPFDKEYDYTKYDELQYFSKINLKGSFSVLLIQGNKNSIEILSNNNICDSVDASVNAGRLMISAYNSVKDADSVQLIITFQNLNEIRLLGETLLTAKNTITTSDITIHLTGGAEIEMKINTNLLDAKITREGSLKLLGNADNADVFLSGNSLFHGPFFNVISFKLKAFDDAIALVNARNELLVKARNNAEITYKGNPALTQRLFDKAIITHSEE